MTIHDRIRDIAAVLDMNGRTDVEIRVIANRDYLMTQFKPKKRGGPLYCGDHKLVLSRPSIGYISQVSLL